MALTIDDIYDKEFAVKGGGYDCDDVDRFLDEICDEMANMAEHIQALEKKLEQAQMEAKAAKANAEVPAPVVAKSESASLNTHMLEGILLSAQRLADEAMENATAKAQGIIDEAKVEAAKIVENAKTEQETLTAQMGTLRSSVAEYKKGFKTLIEKYKTLLDSEDFLGE